MNFQFAQKHNTFSLNPSKYTQFYRQTQPADLTFDAPALHARFTAEHFPY